MNRLLTSLSGYFILIICFLIPATIFAKPAKVKSVTVHFAQLPSINLPCGDLELVYYPEYAQYEKLANLKSSQKPINSIRIQHKKLLKKAERLKKELKKSLDDFLLAAYADFRAKQSQDIKLGIETEIRFLFQQISWYYALSMVNRNDAEIFKTAQEYYKRTAPLFIHLNYKQRVALIEKLSARLACLHEHRQAAFDKVSEAQRYSAEELSSFKKNKTTTKEEASRRATDIAKFASYGREYMWMAAGVSSLTTILRTMLTAHETALLNKKLHPKLMELNEKYGASIGPADRFPNDSSYIAETRRIRLEITKTRAQVALNYMYLKQLQAEKIFVSQLNFASGATAGLLKTGTIAQKAYKDFIRTNDLLPYEEEVKVGKDARKAMQKQGIDFKTFKRKHHQDPLTVELALIAIAYESASSSFMLVASSVKDLLISWLPSGFGIKTAHKKAKKTYKAQKQKIDFSIKVIKKLINDLDPDRPDAYRQGQALMNFVIGKPFNSHIAKQVPNELHRLLEDEGFIAATGGGLGWILEPLCNGPVQRTSLLMHAARYALTGNARTAFHRIAFDRGIVLDNPDLPLTKDILKGNSNADYAESGYQKIVTQASIQGLTDLMYKVPILGEAKFAYDKIPAIRNLLKFEGQNEPTQDEFLLSLILQQEVFDLVIAALKKVKYNYSRLSLEDPQSFNKHLSLLVQSPEYLAAYTNIRHAYWERSKMFNDIRYSKFESKRLMSEGKAIIASIDRAHELDTTDLTARRAYLKMVHHLSSINYLAAAQELKAFETSENKRRSAYGIKEKADLSKAITLIKKRARLSEVHVTTTNLIKELTIQYVTAGLINRATNSIISRLPAQLGVKTIATQKMVLSRDILNAINPWFGKFTTSGVWDVVSGGVSDAVVESATQLSLTHLKLDKEWEGSLNQFFTYTTKVGTNVGGTIGESVTKKIKSTTIKIGTNVAEKIKSATIESYRTRKEVKKRLDELFKVEEPVQTRLQQDNQVNADLLHAIAQKDWKKVKALKKEVYKRAQKAATDNNTLRYKRLKAGIDDALDLQEHLTTSNKNNVQTLEAGEVAKSSVLKKISLHKDGDSSVLKTAGRIVSIVDFKQEMNTGTPSIASLKRLTDTSDEAGLHKHLLKDGFDIYLVRKGLQAAKNRVVGRIKIDKKNSKKYKAELEQIENIAKEIDDKRIELINNNLEEFFNKNPEHKNMVVSVIQGGAAKGNPEYQGIFGDIDFTILTRPGADGVKIKKDLEAFFKEKGHPMATKKTDGYSPMDTEAFIQGIGFFDAARESLANIIKDVSVKMGDPTRFYSEAGGKWFINNMAYSGKTLWGQKLGTKKWVKITSGEAHGLALDMARYLGFLTDPKYESTKIAGMKDNPAAQRKTLESALKKTKYFIRLIDAYMISHDQGNDLYHERMSHRKDEGDDASYHWQIYKDAERLIKGGKKTIFDQPGDLEMIKAMAEMKMKGKNPSPLDVFRNGPEGEKKGMEERIKEGIKMVARMEKLAAGIMAHTAQVHLDETLKIAKSGSPEERRSGFSDQMRMASTSRKIGEVDDIGSKPLMMPKAEIIKRNNKETLVVHSKQTQIDNILTRMEQERLIRKVKNKYEQQIDSLIMAQPKDDPQGLTTRLKVAKLVEETYGEKIVVPKSDSAAFENLQHDSYLHHYKLYWALAGKLIKGLDKPSEKGAE